MSKESKYLVTKIEAFDLAFKFFSTRSARRGVDEKMMIFLANIDFWDWEIENLIYSVANFEDRSKAFETLDDLLSGIMKKGFILKRSKLEDIKYTRRREKRYLQYFKCAFKNPVVAPVGLMNQVIEDWNEFLTRIEKRLMSNTAKSFEDWGESMKANLSAYKKEKLEEEKNG